jgi:hypothetical protein
MATPTPAKKTGDTTCHQDIAETAVTTTTVPGSGGR